VFRDQEVAGASIAATVRHELTEKLTGGDIDYNLVFTTNGIACTSATVVAAALGVQHLDEIDDATVTRIRQGHLLLAMYNAWQPGAIALSAWDVLGALTVPQESVAELMAEGDTRWIERGAIDILDTNPDAEFSEAGLPRARTLYGPIPAQLDDPDSFLSQLSHVLHVREQHRLPQATQVDVPDVSHPGLLVLVHRLDDGNPNLTDARMQVTVLNFSAEPVLGIVRSDELPARRLVTDAVSREVIGRVDDLQSFPVQVAPMSGLFLVLGGEETPTSAIPIVPSALG
jgi:trehalose synthase